ncbi:MAG: phosphodiester glycosidase family protein [Deltaproteobacteria bacterium]|jgi:hypothetical protein|nr:phosphodiester glycosidase family protein [Deltaproteobacteria bacterium]
MIRYFCQTLYLAALSVMVFSGCLAMASGPELSPSDFPEGSLLRSELWALAPWLGPSQARSAGAKPLGDLFWRETLVPQADGLPQTRLAMGFSDHLSSWPMALEIECPAKDPSGQLSLNLIRDARPFGRENLSLEKYSANDPAAKPNHQAPKAKLNNPPAQAKKPWPQTATSQPANSQDYSKNQLILEKCLAQAKLNLSQGPYFEPFVWERLEEGLFRASTLARFGPRLGPKEIILVKASPEHFRLAPYHESERQSWQDFPGTVKAWAKRLPNAPFIINGGQYYPNRSYMGSLRRQGQDLGGPEHSTFKGFWLLDPKSPEANQPKVSLLDRELTPNERLSPQAYDTVIQSYMVLDSLGRVRVKTTERLASRAVLGHDQAGNFVIVVVKGAITMSDLALLSSKLGLVSALGLDGGLETQLAFNGPNGPEFQFGRYSNSFLGNFQIDDLTPSLPSIIALERLEPQEAPPSP